MLDRLFLAISTRLPLLGDVKVENIDAGGGTTSLASNILRTVAGIAGVIIAIILIISILKAVFNYAKGSGQVSIISIIGRVIFLGVCIGLIVLAVNWKTIGRVGEKISDAGFNAVEQVADQIGSGG